MSTRILSAVLVLLSSLALTACSRDREPEPWAYEVPNTQVFNMHSDEIGQTYEIRVALPDSYGTEDQAESYPLLVLLDADYSFAIARNVVQHLAKRNHQLPEMIIVAIAYPGAEEDYDLYHVTRTRDYTPIFFETGGYGPEVQQHSGGGPAFLRFIANDLFPELEERYPVDPVDRTLEGHSYGGLFTTWALLTRPELFARWVIVSPSYWYADRYIYDYEQESLNTSGRMDEVVFMGVGSWENQAHLGRAAMVDDLNELADQIRAHGYEGLSLDTYVFEDDTHASVWPAAITRGLRSVFGEPLPGAAEPEDDEADETDGEDADTPPAP